MKKSPEPVNAAAGGVAAPRYCRAPGVVARKVAGEMLLVPVRRTVDDLAALFALNATGEAAWALLEQPRDAAELGAALAEQFAVDPATAATDCAGLLSKLASEGLVVEVS